MSNGVKIDTDYYFRVLNWEPYIVAAEDAISNASTTISTRALDSQQFTAAGPSLVAGLREVVAGVQAAAIEAGGADFAAMVGQGDNISAIAGTLNGLYPDTPEGRAAEAKARAAQVRKSEDPEFTPNAVEVEQTALFFEEHGDDPEVMKVFYAEVPPEALLNYTVAVGRMPMDSQDYGAAYAQHHLIQQSGPALGSASKMGVLPPGYADGIVEAVHSPESGLRGQSWALSKTLEHGTYETGFITTVTNGLLEIPEDHLIGWNNEYERPIWLDNTPTALPVEAAFGAMTRAGDVDAIFNVTTGKVDTLGARQWSNDGLTQYTAAIEMVATDPRNRIQAGKMATEAVQDLPASFDATDPSMEARQSFANILAYHWPEVAAVSLADSGETAQDVTPYEDYMDLPDPVTSFTREEVDNALGVIMELSDLDPNNVPAAGSPTATIIGSYAEFGAYQFEKVVGSQSDNPELVNEHVIVGEIDRSAATLGFLTEAGFADDIQEGEDYDAAMEQLESLTATLVSAAAGTAIAAVPGGGTVAPAVVKAGGTWGVTTLTEAAFPDSDRAGELRDESSSFQESSKKWIREQWAIIVASHATPIDGEPKKMLGPGGQVIDISGIVCEFTDDGRLDLPKMSEEARRAVADRTSKAYRESPGIFDANADAGAEDANSESTGSSTD